MMTGVSYERAHLIVAALRVLGHRDGRAPDEESIAHLLGLPPEYVRAAIRHMAEHSIVQVVRTPFEVRVELGDHTQIESLPHEEASPAMEQEVRQFLGGRKDKQASLERLFGSEEVAERTRSRQAGLEDKLKGFRPRTPLPSDADEEDAS